MAEPNQQIRRSVLFYDNEIDIIKKHKEKHKLGSDTESLRHIINTFDPTRELRKNKLVYLIYPGLITILLFAISQINYNFYTSTLQQGVPFQLLFDMGQLFMILGVGALFWFFINLFIYRDRVLGKGLKKL